MAKTTVCYLLYASAKSAPELQGVPCQGGTIYVRAELYRGGSDPLEYGERNARPDEFFLNSIQVELIPPGRPT